MQGLIRLLSTCASGSAGAAESLLKLRISSTLKDVLAGSGLISSTSVTASPVNRPPEQVRIFGLFVAYEGSVREVLGGVVGEDMVDEIHGMMNVLLW